MPNAEFSLTSLEQIAMAEGYPSPSLFSHCLEAAISALRNESPATRPGSPESAPEPSGVLPGEPGGLVRIFPPKVLIVPDIHARKSFLLDIVKSPLPTGGDTTVWEALDAGELSVICLGDIPHSEGMKGYRVWTAAAKRLEGARGPDGILGPEMDDEMGASLGALAMVCMLKARFPASFHCLKGNHDNLGNSGEHGDSPFYKFAAEGAMGAEWLRLRYGMPVLRKIREYERLLPVCAAGSRFCASHAEPAFAVSSTALADYRRRPDIVRAMIWTANDAAELDSVTGSLRNILGDAAFAAGARWFSGHRPVKEGFALRAGGRLLQIHDPDKNQVVYLDNGKGEGAPPAELLEIPGEGRPPQSLGAIPPAAIDQSGSDH